jgi:hypothetical protein
MGTHEQLLNEDGLYRKLWQIQGALEEDLTREMNGTPDVHPGLQMVQECPTTT